MKSFYMDQTNSTGNDFIFDDVYKNAKNKNKFSKNPKFVYFNALMKMKKKLSDKNQIYSQVFCAPKFKE